MSSDVDVYNGDIISMLPGSQQEPPLYKSVSGDGITDRNSAGEIQAIKLDMTKAGNTFIDLRPVLNANQSDGNFEMPIIPLAYGKQITLDGFKGKINGIYPDKKHTFVIDTALGNTGNVYRFLWPSGVFQATGKYVFTITFENEKTGEKITSKECFFEVEPNLLTMAVNFSEGISPFDSEYERWKNEVENEMSDFRNEIIALQKEKSDIKGILEGYEQDATSYVDKAWQDKLNGENTWTKAQHFNGGLTFSHNLQGDNAILETLGVTDITATGNVKLPEDTKFGNTSIKSFLHVDNRGHNGGATLLNKSLAANKGKYWLWCARYVENAFDDSAWPTWHFHFSFYLDTADVGKPFAQFEKGFLAGANDGRIVVPVSTGNITFHMDANNDTLILDKVDGTTGNPLGVSGGAWG